LKLKLGNTRLVNSVAIWHN